MKLALSKREWRAVLMLGSVVLMVGWIYLTYGLFPLRRRSVELTQEVRTARQQLAILEGLISKEDVLRREFRRADETVKSLRQLLPSQEELPVIIERLSDFAAQTQVRIQTVLPQRAEDQSGTWEPNHKPDSGAAAVYEEVFIQIDAVAGYHQLGNFIALMEAEPRPLRVISLRVTGNEKEPRRHHVKMLVQMYVAKGALEVPGAA